MDKTNAELSFCEKSCIQNKGTMPGRGKGETYMTGRLNYAVDIRVVIPDLSDSRQCRLHNVGLTHKRFIMSTIGARCIWQSAPQWTWFSHDRFGGPRLLAAACSSLCWQASTRCTASSTTYNSTKTFIIPHRSDLDKILPIYRQQGVTSHNSLR